MEYKRIDEELEYKGLATDNGPFVKELILPVTLYKYAQKRGNETYKEVGFYLIGIFRKGICYVYDLIEFEYSEQSGGFIESGLARSLRLNAGLPFGLQIVGHMHKHPGFTEYSATDKRNFLQYGNAKPLNAFLIYMVDPYNQIDGYTATAEKIFPIKVNIRDLTTEEMLLEKEIHIAFRTKMLVPKNLAPAEFGLLFSEKIGSEFLKFFSRPTIEIENLSEEQSPVLSEKSKVQIIPRRAVEIEELGKNNTLRYRIFLEENETIADLEKILKKLTYIPKQKGYDIVFYEEGRKLLNDTAIKEINHPLMWSLEKSVLPLIFKKFYEFWKGIVNILIQKEVEQVKATPAEAQQEKPIPKTQIQEKPAEIHIETPPPESQKAEHPAEPTGKKAVAETPIKETLAERQVEVVTLSEGVKEKPLAVEKIRPPKEVPKDASEEKDKKFKRDRLDYFI